MKPLAFWVGSPAQYDYAMRSDMIGVFFMSGVDQQTLKNLVTSIKTGLNMLADADPMMRRIEYGNMMEVWINGQVFTVTVEDGPTHGNYILRHRKSGVTGHSREIEAFILALTLYRESGENTPRHSGGIEIGGEHTTRTQRRVSTKHWL